MEELERREHRLASGTRCSLVSRYSSKQLDIHTVKLFKGPEQYSSHQYPLILNLPFLGQVRDEVMEYSVVIHVRASGKVGVEAQDMLCRSHEDGVHEH